jgi:hypothetical protein
MDMLFRPLGAGFEARFVELGDFCDNIKCEIAVQASIRNLDSDAV